MILFRARARRKGAHRVGGGRGLLAADSLAAPAAPLAPSSAADSQKTRNPAEGARD